MSYEHAGERLIPKFVRTQHLPLEPNAQRDDLIASAEDAELVFNTPLDMSLTVEEKVDGANVGMTIYNGEPLIRNRNHILNKAYGKKKTPAKLQFTPIWTWFYTNMDKFEYLAREFGFMPTLYAEWLYAQHSVRYDLLPSYCLVFDVYDPTTKKFLAPELTRPVLVSAGFHVVDAIVIACGKLKPKELVEWRDQPSAYSSIENREGLYIKVSKGDYIERRFKMVRPGFIQGEHWNESVLTKNKVKR